ncbi:hypothetical protein BCR39DRAFT_68265 [Naematelia encephala]|uniref:Uncharacterized protein n=1 Tax=Naematelia encephala TaxID=71784 RepID=A0A1Y2BAS5_9TREE|nr:hypothetical protein BCR39DRAFT_68265 [Naematelia encephala]
MGSFGRGPPAVPAHGPLYGKHLIGTAWPPVPPGAGGPQLRPPPRSNLSHSSQPLESIVDEDRSTTSSSFTTKTTTMPKSIPSPNGTGFGFAQREQVDQVTVNSLGTRQSLSSVESSTMTIKPDDAAGGPNKPKLKGQIASLAKMLSGLKTKGKE